MARHRPTLSLMKEEAPDPGDIEAVEVFTYGMAAIAVGKGVSERDTFVSAQFSIPYVVAACILDRALGPMQLTEKRMADTSLLALSNKVTVRMDEVLNGIYPEKTSSRVEIVLRDGRRLVRQVTFPRGIHGTPWEADAWRHGRFFADTGREAGPVHRDDLKWKIFRPYGNDPA